MPGGEAGAGSGTPAWCKAAAAVAVLTFVAAAASGLWGWQQHREAQKKDAEAERWREAAQAESARAESLWRRLARTDSAEEALRDSIGRLLDEIDAELPGLDTALAEAGDSLEATLELMGPTIEHVRERLPEGAKHLAGTLEAQRQAALGQWEVRDSASSRFREQMRQKVRLLVQDTLSLHRQLDSTRTWGEGERRAKEAWQDAWGRMEMARDEWRDAARKSPLEALFGETIWQVGGTLASAVIAVQQGPETALGWGLAKGTDVAVTLATEPRPAAVDTMELEPPEPEP